MSLNERDPPLGDGVEASPAPPRHPNLDSLSEGVPPPFIRV